MGADQIIQQFKALSESEQSQIAKFIVKKAREDFVLSRYPDRVTVGDLRLRLENPDVLENKQYIIQFIDHRLRRRYIVPVNSILPGRIQFIDHRLRRRYIVPVNSILPGSRSGFLIMAV